MIRWLSFHKSEDWITGIFPLFNQNWGIDHANEIPHNSKRYQSNIKHKFLSKITDKLNFPTVIFIPLGFSKPRFSTACTHIWLCVPFSAITDRLTGRLENKMEPSHII